MNIAGIKKANTENGIGIRVSVFVSGCLNHCKGCFNKETWDFNYGYAYTDDVEDRIITELQKPYYEGITILGGDPFELVNQKGVLQLIERVKKDCPDKDIWMYTGYLYNVDLMPKSILDNNMYVGDKKQLEDGNWLFFVKKDEYSRFVDFINRDEAA